MLNQLIKNVVTNHRRMALMASACAVLSACVAEPGDTGSSSSAGVSSTAAESSSAVQSSSSIAVSSSSEVISSSSISSSSSAPVSSSSITVSSSSAAVSSSSSAGNEPDRPYTIEKIDCNDPDDYNGDATVIFNGSGSFNGAFFNKDFNSATYQNLSRSGSSPDYVLTQNAVADASCTNRNVHTGTWVKKLGDWSGQHSNGVNAPVNRAIGDIDSIVLELRINSALTDVPSKSDIAALYGNKLDQTGLDRLDAGKVNFALTLNNPDDTTGVRGEVFIEIDQDLYADQWIRITVPKDNLVFWTAENWTKTPVDLNTANAATATNIYMNPEAMGNDGPVNYGNVVRNILNISSDNDWAALNITEDFKEMNISIRNFEIRYEPTDGNVQSSSSAASSSTGSTSSSSSSPAAGNILKLDFESEALNTIPTGWRSYVGYNANTPSATNDIRVDATKAHSGTQSLWVNGGANGPTNIVKRLPENSDRIYMRAWYWMNISMGNMPADNHEHVMSFKAYEGGDDTAAYSRAFTADKEARVGQGKGHLGFNYYNSGVDPISPATGWGTGPETPANQWYCIEAAIIKNPVYDELHMWVDDTLVNSVTSAMDWHTTISPTWAVNMFGYAAIGWHSFSGRATEMWIDDVVISTERIGCN